MEGERANYTVSMDGRSCGRDRKGRAVHGSDRLVHVHGCMVLSMRWGAAACNAEILRGVPVLKTLPVQYGLRRYSTSRICTRNGKGCAFNRALTIHHRDSRCVESGLLCRPR